ncbi:MAG: hypothetical protein RMJ67_01125 [Elusimicrobiota bacterium]|nr:hypothetical protein [Endomicrobiia bacterium]MDW8165105.1 hypothetical protein [Elusimicrobiota bacterium]
MKGIRFIQIKKPYTQIPEDLALIGFANQINLYRREDFLKKLGSNQNSSYFNVNFLVYKNDKIMIDILDRVYILVLRNNQGNITSIRQFFQFFKFPPPFSTFAGYKKNITYTLEVPILLKKGDVIRSIVYYHKTYEEIYNFPFVLVCSNLKEDLDKARNVAIISGNIFELDKNLTNNFFFDEIKVNSINNITRKVVVYFLNYSISNGIISYFKPGMFTNHYKITRLSINKVFGLTDSKFPFSLRRSVDFIEIPVEYKTDYTHYEISFAKEGNFSYNSVFSLLFELEML